MDKISYISGNNDYISFLSREKQFSDQILNNSRSMITIVNRNYIYEKVNETFCKAHLGIADSIIGKTLADVWGQEIFSKHIKENVDRCFAGSVIKYEASFATPQSGRRFFEVVFRPIPSETGEVSHLISETFDITELKLSEKIAIRKEEEFRKFETNLPIGFLRCQPDGEILQVNNAFMVIMESDEEKVLCSRNLRSYYPDEEIFRMHIEQLSDGKPRSFGRVPLKTCCGNDIVCRISAFMTLDDTGAPAFIDFSFEDSSRELMLENRLLQAQKLETIGALAGGIAHDFNNILTTISGYSEMLIEDLPVNCQALQNVQKIQSALSKARSLTNQILTFSRQVEQEKVTVNSSEVLKETVNFIKSVVPRGIKVKTGIHKKNALVCADPTQLFRVFLNLLTNAVQSMEERGGVLTVNLSLIKGKNLRNELSTAITADEYVLVKISDTGKGMDPSLLRRIFEPFFTTRDVGKGSGLGLSVVHGIVTEMGGEILVSSEKDRGSVFYVYLPVSSEIETIQLHSHPGKKIVFYRGDRYEPKILSLGLQGAGYELIKLDSLKNLEEILQDETSWPDLMIYMHEPDDNRAQEIVFTLLMNKPSMPLIVIDDPDHQFPEEKLLNSGLSFQHLIKPVSLRDIKDAIDLALNS